MTDTEKFEVFKLSVISNQEKLFGQEARQTYGQASVAASQEKLLSLSEEDFAQSDARKEQILNELAQAVRENADPTGPRGRAIAALHKQWLCYCWEEYKVQAHIGLVQLYLDDPRFTAYYDRTQPGCAAFLAHAVQYWAEHL